MAPCGAGLRKPLPPLSPGCLTEKAVRGPQQLVQTYVVRKLLIPERSLRPLRTGLRTELANQHIIPEQKHIRLEADVLTIRLPRVDQNVDLVTVMEISPPSSSGS